jgi:hypothetical protein
MKNQHRITKVWFENGKIFVQFSDSHVIYAEISLYPNLRKGTPEQMNKYELWDHWRWIHWEELDEDLSAEGSLKNGIDAA